MVGIKSMFGSDCPAREQQALSSRTPFPLSDGGFRTAVRSLLTDDKDRQAMKAVGRLRASCIIVQLGKVFEDVGKANVFASHGLIRVTLRRPAG